MEPVKYLNPALITAIAYDTDTQPASGRYSNGYGRAIPTPMTMRIRTDGKASRVHRVYIVNYGNSGSAYVKIRGEWHFLCPDAESYCEAARDGYRVALEYAGYPEPVPVARFRGEWIAAPGDTWQEAWDAAARHNRARIAEMLNRARKVA